MFETSLSASQVTQALYETFVMLGWSLLIGGLWGLVQGTVMVLIRDNGVRPNVALFRILTPIINTLRSVPFIILLIALIPITKFIVGTQKKWCPQSQHQRSPLLVSRLGGRLMRLRWLVVLVFEYPS